MIFLDTARSSWQNESRSAPASGAGLRIWARRIAEIAALLALAVITAGPASAQSRCRISDPTGTPLNVRAWPNGEVKGQIRNGVLVAVEDQQRDDRGRPWALIRSRDGAEVYGWVFREFIACF